MRQCIRQVSGRDESNTDIADPESECRNELVNGSKLKTEG